MYTKYCAFCGERENDCNCFSMFQPKKYCVECGRPLRFKDGLVEDCECIATLKQQRKYYEAANRRREQTEERLKQLVNQWSKKEIGLREGQTLIKKCLDSTGCKYHFEAREVYDSPAMDIVVLQVAYIDETGDLVTYFVERHNF